MYDLEGPHVWIKEIEKKFRVMACSKVHKVRFDTHMLLRIDGITRVKDWKVMVLRSLGLCLELDSWRITFLRMCVVRKRLNSLH